MLCCWLLKHFSTLSFFAIRHLICFTHLYVSYSSRCMLHIHGDVFNCYFLKDIVSSEESQLFNVHGFVHRKNILIYIQQDATLHSLFYLETAQHVSGGTTIHHQERKQLYLQQLVFVTPLVQ